MDKVITELRRLADGGEPDFLEYGICSQPRIDAGVSSEWLEDVFEALGLDRIYPIEASVCNNPKARYEVHANHYILWSGRQGELRRALCARVADYLEHTDEY